jgi:hypothetical protein
MMGFILQSFMIFKAGIVQSVERRAGRPGFDFRQREGYYSLQMLQDSCGVHPSSYTMGTGGMKLTTPI